MKIAGALALLLMLAVHPASAAKGPSFAIDGKVVATSPSPVIRHGRLYVPVRVLSELGLYLNVDPVYRGARRRMVQVGWPESDSFLYFKRGRAWVVYEGPHIRERTIDRTPFMRRGALMVPLRLILREWPISAEWNARTKTVNLHRIRLPDATR